MPKRRGYLYQWMCDRGHIRSAMHKAAQHKRNRGDVKAALAREDECVEGIYAALTEHTYTPCAPRRRTIYDQSSRKERVIEYVRFYPDAIIQTLMIMAMESAGHILTKGMYQWCCASVPGRGSAAARKYTRRVIRNDPKGTRYVCKMDVHHYFHSVDRDVLMAQFGRRIKDRAFLELVRAVLDTSAEGLAIGYYVCQWFANYYLEGLDRFITGLDGVRHMVRYMDDIVLFGPNKRKLRMAREAIALYLDRQLHLHMKGNWQIWPLRSRPLDFVGYKFYPNKTTLRRSNYLRLKRQAAKVMKRMKRGDSVSYKMAAGLTSRVGMLKHCDGRNIFRKYIEPVGMGTIRKILQDESRRRTAASGGMA